jgi:hypothetical protein
MELSIRDVLNIQTHDHNAQRPPSGVMQSVPAQQAAAGRMTSEARQPEGELRSQSTSGAAAGRMTSEARQPEGELRSQSSGKSVTHSVPARRHQPSFDDEDAASTSVLIPDQRLLDAAAGRASAEPTTEVRLDAALLTSIRRTEEIHDHDHETSTFSIPSDLLKLASQNTPSASRTIPLPAVTGPVTINLPSGAIEPITMRDEDDTQTRPVGHAPIEAIATVDAHGRLVLPAPVLAVSGLRPGQRVKIVAYIIK